MSDRSAACRSIMLTSGSKGVASLAAATKCAKVGNKRSCARCKRSYLVFAFRRPSGNLIRYALNAARLDQHGRRCATTPDADRSEMLLDPTSIGEPTVRQCRRSDSLDSGLKADRPETATSAERNDDVARGCRVSQYVAVEQEVLA